MQIKLWLIKFLRTWICNILFHIKMCHYDKHYSTIDARLKLKIWWSIKTKLCSRMEKLPRYCFHHLWMSESIQYSLQNVHNCGHLQTLLTYMYVPWNFMKEKNWDSNFPSTSSKSYHLPCFIWNMFARCCKRKKMLSKLLS